MEKTYSQLYIHLIFAVNGTAGFIAADWKEELYKYISGIVTRKGQKMLAINGTHNHIHLLLGFRPDCVLSDLVRDIKANSSRWVNERGFVHEKFQWQHGFGGFSVSRRKLDEVGKYIHNQETYHRDKSFREEFVGFLEDFGIEYKPEYLFTDEEAGNII